MPRVVEITVPSHRTDRLLEEIQKLDEIFGLRLQRGGSLSPPGDVISVSLTNNRLRDLIRILDEQGMTEDEHASISISEPTGVISPSTQEAIEDDTSDVIWEEAEFAILRESRMGPNGLLVMVTSGLLAAIGIATGAVHLVIGAMVIAPGFEPITRVSLGFIARGREGWRNGLLDTIKGYAALFVGALAAGGVLFFTGRPLLTGGEAYLPTEALVSFWLELSVPAVLVTAFAGAAGAALVAVNRSVLTAGVMIALALVPPPAIAGLALVAGDLDVARRAGVRWGVEVVIVAVAGLLVFLWKRVSVQRRKMVM